MRAKAGEHAQGEGRDALAFVFAGLIAAVVLLPTRQLLDLKQAAALLAAAWLCLGLAWKGTRGWEPLALAAWRAALLGLCVWAVGTQGLHRIPGNFGNAGYFAAFIILSWPLVLLDDSKLRPWALSLALLALLSSGSRTALVALLIQVLVLGWRHPSAWKAIRPGLVVLALLAFLLFGAEGLLRPTLRWELWRQTIDLALQHPWFGWGWEPFVLSTHGLWTGVLAQSLEANAQMVEHPHQLLLGVFFHGGLLGLALFGAVVAYGARWFWSRRDERSALLGLGLLGLLVQAQADRFFFHVALLGPPALVLLSRYRRPLPNWARLGLLVASVGLAAAALRPIQAWRQAVVPVADSGPVSSDDPATLSQLAAGNTDPAFWDRYGNALAAHGDFKGAEGAFRQALVFHTTAGRAINLGNCLMMQGKPLEAEASFRHAASLDAKNADARFSLGYALYQQRKLKAAVAALDEALLLEPNHAEAFKLKEQILK